MIKAAIMDMDGVLIDSEPLWQEAEIRIFSQVGIDMTPEMAMETMGIRIDEVVKYRYDQQPWQGKTLKQVENEILDELERLIRERGEPMKGVDYILAFFRQRSIRLALASSSYIRVINAVLKKLNLENTFEVIHSGEFEENGKPHPAIYLSTLKKLQVSSDEAIAFEDSYNGIKSAKAADLKTVALPEKSVWHEQKYDLADLKLKSLLEFKDEHLQPLAR
ncbi:hexitol phosphatase HxpB [candidate division KSB1 bacterium]|nr:hexitol phosphatase HxpB [candidate division KSB1 bacterium]NIR70460.1 hexitol phosphatase HxpB [candidate division KSB1 bacterium]NIS23190.1 hexitol phosphatase HxpB [candidate division KSB1 bacterium]NIT70050.1 hexitol phosphatase HxpB [candidate division KSB1 bacterium]NIU23687.1 hexitol phosphatase HxpB [candidate division KSB1 bacterium]